MMTRPADPAIDEAAAPSRARSARALVQAVRWRTGLSQADFARVFHIDLTLLEDLEHGDVRPDAALTAYLRVIDHAPDVVRAALRRADS
ncbi:helix-turn-helix domain-containing protein [Caulobacter segnis]